MLLWWLLALVLVFLGNMGSASSSDQCDVWRAELRQLLVNHTYVMDPTAMASDRAMRAQTHERLPLLLQSLTQDECGGVLPETILHDAVRAVYRAHNHIAKDMLASSRKIDVTWADMEAFAAEWVYEPWTALVAATQRPIAARTDAKGYTILHLATLFREMRLVRDILQLQGGAAVVNAVTRDKYRQTALHIAVAHADVDAAELLLEHGADAFSIKDAYGRTALDLAVHIVYYVPALQELLLANGPADATACPLHPSLSVLSKPSAPIASCPFARMPASQLDVVTFERDFISVRQPLILTGATDSWRVQETWQPRHLADRNGFGSLRVRLGPIPYANVFGEPSADATLTEYMAYMASSSAASKHHLPKKPPAYVFDGQVMGNAGGAFFDAEANPLPTPVALLLMNQTADSTDTVGPNGDVTVTTDDTRVRVQEQFILGPRYTGAPLHYHCDAVNALLWGRKHWLLVPPAHSVYSKNHPLNYIKQFGSADRSANYRCEQNAHDLVYVPAFWTHATLNMEDSLCIAFEFDRGDC